jgi:FKBP-type peptidyl-prolyl cis-trans isomerase FkpA
LAAAPRRPNHCWNLPLKQSIRHFALTAALVAAAACTYAAPAETLPSGVQITVLTPGKSGAAMPKVTDTVTVHYRGTLQNGTEFDSSYKRGQPASFPLSRVIPCWTQGLQKLSVGSKALLVCPGSTAYGERGMPGTIPPNATLNFEVELLGIAG